MTPLIVAGLVLAGIAAALHVYIFYMESFAWTTSRVRAVFGMSKELAEANKELAYNQGFYNLFLAVVTVVGIVLTATGHADAGPALVLAGAGSMAAAALVLLLSSPRKRKAALTQGTIPALAVVTFAVGLLV